MLSIDQMARYHRDGFLTIEDFVSPEACAALLERATEIVAAFEPEERRTTFRTDDEQVGDRELLASAAGIRCFFEPDAFGADGTVRRDNASTINKIGHAMHDLDPVFEAFTYTRELASVGADVGLTDPLALQSMYLFEQPYIGGEVRCHQDATFLFTDPVTVTGFWFAIQDATIDNGCLWVQPGGHRGPLRRVYQRVEAGPGVSDATTRFVELDETPLPTPPRGMLPIVVPRGTMVVLHGLLPHWSDVNRSPVSRHAYSVHCVSASADYPSSNWLQRPPELPFRRVDEVSRVLRNLTPAPRERGASEAVSRG